MRTRKRLQKGLAGVLACDVVENGGGKERICGIAQGIADYIVEVHAQLAERERKKAPEGIVEARGNGAVVTTDGFRKTTAQDNERVPAFQGQIESALATSVGIARRQRPHRT